MSGHEELANVVGFPERERTPFGPAKTPYAELAAVTNFSFLRGASPAKEMVLASLMLGYKGLGIADRNTLSALSSAHA